MAERRGVMRLFDEADGDFTVLHGLHEVRPVRSVAALGERHDPLVVVVVDVRVAGFGHRDVAALALHDYADPRTAESIHGLHARLGGQTAHFKNQRRFGVAERGDQGVRGLGVILVTKTAAHAHHRRRQTGLAEEPARDVHLVNTLVGDIAAAVVPDPVPIVVHRTAARAVAPWRRKIRRPRPKIVTFFADRSRHRLRPRGATNALAQFVAQTARILDFAQFARAHVGNGLHDIER